MRFTHIALRVSIIAVLFSLPTASAQQAAAPAPHVVPQPQVAPAQNLAIKYMRDSQEYSTLVRQIYRGAANAIGERVRSLPKGSWAVSLDIDETALDNSAYQLERAAYAQEHSTAAFNSWVARREARAIPGAVDFVNQVRKLGGRVVWISDRDVSTSEATRQNLAAVGLWAPEDRLCLREPDRKGKRFRRQEVTTGSGKCSWDGARVKLMGFVGDQMGDFPAPDENIPEAGSDADFGRSCFLLPNPTYGKWATSVTRVPEN